MEIKKGKEMIIAVDFDGTLCEHKFPNIGKANIEVINLIKKFKSQGHQIILWTCRDGIYLEDAVKWCKNKFGIYFDAINDNVQEVKDKFVKVSNKIYADIYIDDRNYCFKCDKWTEIK